MSRKAQTQWEFQGLLPAEPTRRVLTVSELTSTVRRLIEKEMGDVWVSGEVTNLRAQPSGHLYFTLKDGGAQLSCVLFRGETVSHREFLQDGQKLLLRGGLTVYEPRGQYQMIVRGIEPQGIGALQLAFEKLKKQLQAEGLFAPERKRPLPRYPRRIGLVTSPAGAAIRDVLHVIGRRQPSLEVVLAPCRVQGEGAAAEIAAAIRLLNRWSQRGEPGSALDLILVTRGGGSLEDLWAFNEEVVARAVFESALPVVSAVGHEIDFTIIDFVADLRAATPSAAAELITEGMFSSRQRVLEMARRLRQQARGRLQVENAQLSQLAARLGRLHPRRRLEEQLQYLDDLQVALARCARQGLRERVAGWSALGQRLARLKPSAMIQERRLRIVEAERRLRDRVKQGWQRDEHRLTNLRTRLALLGPGNVLARGYSLTTDVATGKLVRSAAEVRPGQRLRTRLQAGEIESVVNGLDPDVSC